MQMFEEKPEETFAYDHEKAISDWINEGGALGPENHDEPMSTQ
jgi:hypothetical protein